MEEHLTALAEVAVGLAGFSSVVVVFRRRSSDGAWKPEDAFRFKQMLEASLFAGLFALLPNAIAGLGVSEDALWQVLSGMLLGFLVLDLVRKARGASRLPAASLSLPLVWFSVVGTLMAIAVLALGIAEWLVPRGPGPYVFGVTWLTAYSGVTFYRLVTAPMIVADPGDSRGA